MIDDWGGSSVEVLDERRVRFDPQVMVDRGKEVTCRTGSFDGVFSTLVGRTDDLSGSDTAAGPDIREGSWPVVATWLDRPGRCACITRTGAWRVFDLGSSAEFAGHDDQDALVKSSLVNVFDQSRDGLVVDLGSEPQSVEDVMVDRMIVPIAYPSAQWSTEAGRKNFDPRFDQTSCHEELLAPSVSTIAVACAVVFFGQIEGFLRFRAREQRDRLGFELIKRTEFTGAVKGSGEGIEFLPQVAPTSKSLDLVGIGEPDVGDREVWIARISRDGKGGVHIAKVCWSIVFQRRVDPDIAWQGILALRLIARTQVVRHGHPIGILRLGFIPRFRIPREHLHRAGGVSRGRLSHGSQDGEFVCDRCLPWKQFGELQAGNLGRDGAKGATVFGGRIGLRIVGIDMGAPTWLPDHDDRLAFAGFSSWIRSDRRLESQKPRQAQGSEPSETHGEEISAIGAEDGKSIIMFHGCFTLHGGTLKGPRPVR